MCQKSKFRVWGLANGRRSTKDAVPGAFTWQEYTPEELEEGKKDFQVIIFIEREAQDVYA